ncbi:PKD domain-containing protein [Heliobacterium undosum]|uniref:PKD domain-containing protein n=1 Tax=Heliomicrobium undosum TaxID=121734 RepID=A0A845LE27_9FIRM|nr:PKD domain-containing protein [Heliomicrobium undosum]MZP31171.1 PKD domain-containing protein [Heliomicrobium undosum]
MAFCLCALFSLSPPQAWADFPASWQGAKPDGKFTYYKPQGGHLVQVEGHSFNDPDIHPEVIAIPSGTYRLSNVDAVFLDGEGYRYKIVESPQKIYNIDLPFENPPPAGRLIVPRIDVRWWAQKLNGDAEWVDEKILSDHLYFAVNNLVTGDSVECVDFSLLYVLCGAWIPDGVPWDAMNPSVHGLATTAFPEAGLNIVSGGRELKVGGSVTVEAKASAYNAWVQKGRIKVRINGQDLYVSPQPFQNSETKQLTYKFDKAGNYRMEMLARDTVNRLAQIQTIDFFVSGPGQQTTPPPTETAGPTGSVGDPYADFVASPAESSVGEQVDFIDQSGHHDPNGILVKKTWTIEGKADPVVQQNPAGVPKIGASYTWNKEGVYKVTLKVEDQKGKTASRTKLVPVMPPPNHPPVAKLDFTPKTPKEGDFVTIQDQSYHPGEPREKIVSWDWKVDGQEGITGEGNKTVQWDQAGAYNVTLTVTDQDGEKSTATVTVPVASSNPIAVITVNREQIIVKHPLTITPYLSKAFGGRTIDWTKDQWEIINPSGKVVWQGTQEVPPTNGVDPNPFFDVLGDWKIRLKVTDSGGKESMWAEKIVNVRPDTPPVADFAVDSQSLRFVVDDTEIHVQDGSYVQGLDGAAGDSILKRQWSLYYDSDGDGVYETEVPANTPENPNAHFIVNGTNDRTPVIRAKQVGMFRVELQVWKGYLFNEAPRLTLSADTSGKPLSQKVVEVGNLPPHVDFQINKTPSKVEVLYLNGTMTNKDTKIATLNQASSSIQAKLAALGVPYQSKTQYIGVTGEAKGQWPWGVDPIINATFSDKKDDYYAFAGVGGSEWGMLESSEPKKVTVGTYAKVAFLFPNGTWSTATIPFTVRATHGQTWVDTGYGGYWKPVDTLENYEDVGQMAMLSDGSVVMSIKQYSLWSGDGWPYYKWTGDRVVNITSSGSIRWEKACQAGTQITVLDDDTVQLYYPTGGYSSGHGNQLIKLNGITGAPTGSLQSWFSYETPKYLPAENQIGTFVNYGLYQNTINIPGRGEYWFGGYNAPFAYISIPDGDSGYLTFYYSDSWTDYINWSYAKNTSYWGYPGTTAAYGWGSIARVADADNPQSVGKVPQNYRNWETVNALNQMNSLYIPWNLNQSGEYYQATVVPKKSASATPKVWPYPGENITKVVQGSRRVLMQGDQGHYWSFIESLTSKDLLNALQSMTFTPGSARYAVLSCEQPIQEDGSVTFNDVANYLNTQGIRLYVIGPSGTAVVPNWLYRNTGGRQETINDDMRIPMQPIEDAILGLFDQKNTRFNTVLVYQPVTIQAIESDPENDPITSGTRRWTFVHHPWDASTGLVERDWGLWDKSAQSLTAPPMWFDKPGLYDIRYKVQDNPSANAALNSRYQKWSNEVAGQILVLRPPVADFDAPAVYHGRPISVTDKSYSDDIYSHPNHGIVQREWRLKPEGATDWTYRTLPSSIPTPGNWIFSLRVMNEFGYWSDWTNKTVPVLNAPPVAMFNVNPYPAVLKRPVLFTNASWDPDNDTIVAYKWTVKNAAESVLYSAVHTSGGPDLTFTFLALGNYTVTLEVKDQYGAWSTPYTRTIPVLPDSRPPVADFSIQPNPCFVTQPYATTDLSYDPDGDAITDWLWELRSPDGSVIAAYSGVQNPSWPRLDTTGNYPIRLRVKDSWGLWSGWAEKTLQVIAPLEILDGSLSPNPGLAGERISASVSTDWWAEQAWLLVPAKIVVEEDEMLPPDKGREPSPEPTDRIGGVDYVRIPMTPDQPVGSRKNTWKGKFIVNVWTPDGQYPARFLVQRNSFAPDQKLGDIRQFEVKYSVYDLVKPRRVVNPQ